MAEWMPRSSKALLTVASVLTWGMVGLQQIVQAADTAIPSTAVEEQKTLPSQDSEVRERGLSPSGSAPLQFVGPTDNLTKVINALAHKHKSLTSVITTAPGLQLARPVEISILFISPWGTNARLTQPYQPKFGNRFVYNDPEGDGTPRHLRMDIWLTEPKPEGGHYSYTLSWQVDLDPIYDITVSPLTFTLLSNCDSILGHSLGNSEIRFRWVYPDAPQNPAWNRLSFTTTKGRTVSINQFAWSQTELSASVIASTSLHLPAIRWSEHDPHLGTDFEGRPSFSIARLPGKTLDFQFGLFPGQPYPGPEENRGNTCIARIQYRITYNLRTYPNL